MSELDIVAQKIIDQEGKGKISIINLIIDMKGEGFEFENIELEKDEEGFFILTTE